MTNIGGDVDRVIEHCQKVLRERDELRAENERQANLLAIDQLNKNELSRMAKQFLDERDELLAQIERLQTLAGGLVRDNSQLTQTLSDLRAALTEITDLELEGDATLADAMMIADEALNPPA